MDHTNHCILTVNEFKDAERLIKAIVGTKQKAANALLEKSNTAIQTQTCQINPAQALQKP